MIVAAIPLLISPLNFITGGAGKIGFYFAAVLAPFAFLLLNYWGHKKMSGAGGVSPVLKDDLNTDVSG